MIVVRCAEQGVAGLTRAACRERDRPDASIAIPQWSAGIDVQDIFSPGVSTGSEAITTRSCAPKRGRQEDDMTTTAVEPGTENVARVAEWPPADPHRDAAHADTSGGHHMARSAGVLIAAALAATALLTPGVPATANASGACCTLGTGDCFSAENAGVCTPSGGGTVYQGDGSTCADGCALGACCHLGTDECDAFVDVTTCSSGSGIYQGDGSTCAQGCPLGACCHLGTDQCDAFVDVTTCSSDSGIYQGDGSTCAAGCALGACCSFSGECIDFVDVADCFGDYQGDGTTCEQLLCPPPPPPPPTSTPAVATPTKTATRTKTATATSTPTPKCRVGTVCRPAMGPCDLEESCDAATDSCPADAKSTAVCRPAAGVCDLAESCDGSSDACPADVKSTGVCRPAAGVCDLAESCDGSSDACPADVKSTAVCRPAAGVCDLAESCDGSSDACPADVKSTAVCRPAAGVCDLAESCDGSIDDCPTDVKSTALCRPSAGECDVADLCDRVNDACPADQFQSSTVACSSDGNVCTDDHCDGSGQCVHTPNSAPCDDGDACTLTDVCAGGGCIGTNFSWSGVLPPIRQDGSSIFKYGSSIPVKFKLTGACAGNPNLVADIFLAKISDHIAGSEMEAEATSAATTGNTFLYDPTDDQYVFVLASKPLSPGTWQIRIDLGDMVTDRTVVVSLK
jgi:hypothetical protein